MMVIHHIEKLELFLDDLYRVLKPNGYVVIKEHDCKDESFCNYLHIMHDVYDYAINNK